MTEARPIWWLLWTIWTIGAAFAITYAILDTIDWLDNWSRRRHYGTCSRLGCNRAAVIRAGVGNYRYCDRHAEFAGWESRR